MSDAKAAADGADLLYGAPAIAAFLKVKPRAVYHLIETADLPSFKINKKVCARGGALLDWIARRASAAQTAEA